MGYPGFPSSTMSLWSVLGPLGRIPANSDNRRVDPIVLVIIIAVGMPLAVVFALAASARLRGPMARPESRRPIETLVTEAVPEEQPEPGDDAGAASAFSIDSDPPDADPDIQRGRGAS